MPLTSAERSKLYRQRKRENATEYAAYLEKEKERYQRRKEKGEIKLVSTMTDREKRSARKAWRLRKKTQRQNQINLENRSMTNIDTPPPTPTEGQHGPFPIRIGRRKVRRDRSKAYREIKKLKEQLSKQQRLLERYKKRLYRKGQKALNKDSPRTKTKTMLRGEKVSDTTRKTLLFHNVLITGIRQKYKKLKTERSRQLLSKAITNNLIRKYRLQQMTRKSLGITQRRMKGSRSNDLTYIRKKKQTPLQKSLTAQVEKFLCREDNSRIKAGKKSTKTKNKEKRQIFILKDTLRNLHLKFLAENVNSKMSYSLFCRLKPFYVMQPRVTDRETCLCKRHENLSFKVIKLKE